MVFHRLLSRISRHLISVSSVLGPTAGIDKSYATGSLISFHLGCPISYVKRTCSTSTVFVNEGLQNYLKTVLLECTHTAEKLTAPDLSSQDRRELSKRHAYLSPLAELVKEYYTLTDEHSELDAMQKGNDAELASLAQHDLDKCQQSISLVEQQILNNLVPHEVADMNDIVLEVTAGVGGLEAMLFSKELFDMYQNYAINQGWQLQVVEYSVSELGGMRHAMAMISGVGAYGSLKFEGGVHRVQRVPRTERAGRVHTSTCTVAVLPQPQEIEVQLHPRDLKIETCRSSGKGGQHVNTTDSAVRIVHMPTGEVAECQSERSQLQNKEIAMRVLRSKIYQKQLDAQMSAEIQQRKLQVGTAGRSEKIRTYNYNQDRITDHRIGVSQFGIAEFLDGGRLLDAMIDSVSEASRQERLAEMLEEMAKNYGKS